MRLSPATIECPKCGSMQPKGDSCTECGVVFAKLHARQRTHPAGARARRRNRGSHPGWVRLFQLLTLISLAVLIVSCQQKDRLPDAGFYDLQRLADPRQTATSEAPFEITAGDQRYLIKPEREYRLEGVVVSYHDSDSWWDIYHHSNWKDFINTRDICVIWGTNVASGVYRQMTFENTTWTCWASWPDSRTAALFSMRQLSNNHLLTDTAYINEQIKSAEIGDHVTLEGYLAAYANLDNGFVRGTSTRRDDTGNGACETIYVNHFEIVKKANSGWRALHTFAQVGFGLSLLLLLVFIVKTPFTRH